MRPLYTLSEGASWCGKTHKVHVARHHLKRLLKNVQRPHVNAREYQSRHGVVVVRGGNLSLDNPQQRSTHLIVRELPLAISEPKRPFGAEGLRSTLCALCGHCAARMAALCGENPVRNGSEGMQAVCLEIALVRAVSCLLNNQNYRVWLVVGWWTTGQTPAAQRRRGPGSGCPLGLY